MVESNSKAIKNEYSEGSSQLIGDGCLLMMGGFHFIAAQTAVIRLWMFLMNVLLARQQ